MNIPALATLVLLSIYMFYYVLIVSVNKKYREYIARNNSFNIVINFVVLLIIAMVIVFGLYNTSSGDTYGASRNVYAWILASMACATATAMVASSIYTQVKLRDSPLGIQDSCPAIRLFTKPKS